MPFGQHLCADQNARLAAKGVEVLLQCIATLRTAAINANHRHVRELRSQQLFDAFSAIALRLQA